MAIRTTALKNYGENMKNLLQSYGEIHILTLRAGNTTTAQAYGQSAGGSTSKQAAVQYRGPGREADRKRCQASTET